MMIEVSNGEIVDKYTILKIKLKNSEIGTEKHFNIHAEYMLLHASVAQLNIPESLIEELYTVNKKLWDIEDSIRVLESKKQFDKEFIDLARSVYVTNDKRFQIKKQINQISGSELKEEKILPVY
jgi:hypothetical protein